MQRKVLLQLPLRRTNRGGATILKVGGQILRAERIIPKLCPPVRFGSKSVGHVPPPISYRSAAHAYKRGNGEYGNTAVIMARPRYNAIKRPCDDTAD